jgi:peptide/nickel transport system substrate-binding protein
VAIAAVSVLAVAACSSGGKGTTTEPQSSAGFGECDSKPNTCNSGSTKKGGSIVVTIEKTIPNWNTVDGDGNTYETGQVLAGVLPVNFVYNPDNTVSMNKDLLVSADVTSQSPQTVVYKLQPKAVWSDGTPISAKDFIYFWKLQDAKSCPDCAVAGTTGYDDMKDVVGSDSDKTVTVTFDQPFPDWKSLFNGLYPAHVAEKLGNLTSPAGLKAGYDAFKTNTPNWSGGPYLISDYQKDVSVTLKPNPQWYGKTKPALDSIVFKTIEDQPQQVPALQNKEVQALLSQPSSDLVNGVKGIQGVEYNLGAGPTWEHFDLNTTNKFLKDVALRQAIFTAVDRKSIIDKTVGPFFAKAAPLNNHNIMPGSPGYKDVVTATGQGSGNVDAAKKILTDAGYTGVGTQLKTKTGETVGPFRFRFTTGNTLRQASGEVLQANLKQLGIDVKLEPLTKLGQTLSTGDYDIIIFAWVGSPFISAAKDQWATGGGSNYGKYSNPDVDRLTKEAAQTLDDAKVRDLLNQADEIMSKEAYVLPLYQKPVFIAVYSDYINIRNNATLQGPSYNIGEWGLKATAK